MRKETGRTNGWNGKGGVISDRVAIFGAPGILTVYKNPGFIGELFKSFTHRAI